MSVLVIDVGTSGVRVAVVRPDASAAFDRHVQTLPASPAQGLVELDAAALASTALRLACDALDATGRVDAVGISNQRASVVVWDRATGAPIAPGIGWQDLRTVGRCLELRAAGLRLAPNQSATKFEHILDSADPDRSADLCLGTVDSWMAWVLTEGALHATDATNAAVTGLLAPGATAWDGSVLDALRIPTSTLPVVVDSACTAGGEIGVATALPGTPPITAMLGDQQASLAGQACVRPGDAKITFGTGGMLDLNLGGSPPSFDQRGPAGTFPIIAWRHAGADTWGIESIMLAAGTNVEWLRDDLGLVATAAESHDVAARCADTGDVSYVPALLGLGTPHWDYGARGTLLGITRGTGRPEVVRAVLEGVAHRGADLVEAAETDSGAKIPVLRIDGGMSDNPTFVQALADASQRTVEVSPVREATALGAGLLAGIAVGHRSGIDDIASTWSPRLRVEPSRALDRDRWREACARAGGWIGALSGIDF
ncbi:MAG: FGGY-family carbohydrate kinase [Acidimicrobiia bacterium]|nr:FGGY-family carbohydrate kinase [Acidimicrobiia bacterium]